MAFYSYLAAHSANNAGLISSRSIIISTSHIIFIIAHIFSFYFLFGFDLRM